MTQPDSTELAAAGKWARYPEQLLRATIIGLVAGVACVGLRKFFAVLQWLFTGHAGLLPVAAAQLPHWRRVATPILGAAAATLITWFAHRIGTGRSRDYVEAVHFDDGEIPLKPALWRTLASSFSVATGAAIGREGSMIQFAAAIVSALGERMRTSAMPLSRQVACGVAAAVAVVYQAPIAGIFFAAEIVLGTITFTEAPLLLVSAFIGLLTGWPFLQHGPLFQAPGQLRIGLAHLLPALLLALLIGAFGPIYYWIIHSMSSAKKWPLALVWSGAIVGVLSLSRTEVWGNGDVALLQIMQAAPAVQTTLLVLALRLCATTFCVGAGTVGGVFTPTLFAGSAIGLLFGHLVHAPGTLLFTVIGMTCLLAAVTHAPWMSLFMAIELTGQWTLLPLLLICTFIAWQIACRLSPNALYAIATPEPAHYLFTGAKTPITAVHSFPQPTEAAD